MATGLIPEQDKLNQRKEAALPLGTHAKVPSRFVAWSSITAPD
jgi:hypothetical protein